MKASDFGFLAGERASGPLPHVALASFPGLPMLIVVSDEPGQDGELVARYADGDVAAFEQLYDRHRAALWRFLERQLRDPSATADVFQETWARVIVHADRYRPSAPFRAWLYRIAHHCCVDHWRRSGRVRRREQQADQSWLTGMPDRDTPGPADLVAHAQAGEALQDAILALPEEQRAAFLLYAEAGLSIAEIAGTMGVGPETAKSRLRYAVARLRRALAPMATGGEE